MISGIAFFKTRLIGIINLSIIWQGFYRFNKFLSLFFITLYITGGLFLRVIPNDFFCVANARFCAAKMSSRFYMRRKRIFFNVFF